MMECTHSIQEVTILKSKLGTYTIKSNQNVSLNLEPLLAKEKVITEILLFSTKVKLWHQQEELLMDLKLDCGS